MENATSAAGFFQFAEDVLIGASLSEPHTSVTSRIARRMCMSGMCGHKPKF